MSLKISVEAPLQLLLEGTEGVRRWNQARAEHDFGVSLAGTDFSGRDLSLVDLRDADLSGATFKGANLTAAILRGADVSGSDFQSACLARADFSQSKGIPIVCHADLAGALLDDVVWDDIDLQGSCLRGASLKGAKLGKAKSMTAAQICGADVTDASLPTHIAAFDSLRPAEEAAKNSRALFYLMLGASAYSLLTVASTSDLRLLANSEAAQLSLPLIGTNVPVVFFYWFAPFLLVCCMVYFHLYLQQLWAALARLPAIFPDGRSVDERAYPWLMVVLVRRCLPRLEDRTGVARLQEYASIVLAWFSVPIALTAIWYRFLDRQDRVDSVVHVFWIVASLGFASWFWSLLHDAFGVTTGVVSTISGVSSRWSSRLARPFEFERWTNTSGWRCWAALVTAYAAALFTATFTWSGPHGLDVRLPSVVSERPDNFFALSNQDQLKAVRGVNFWDRRMPGLYARNSFLVRSNFQYADLRWSNLISADLRGANFACADLGGANLSDADLRHAVLTGAFMAGPEPTGFQSTAQRRPDCDGYHRGAVHSDGTCKYRNRKPADHTILVSAKLEHAKLNDATLHFAQMQSAKLRHANLRSAQLQGANLEFADLRNADLRGAGLEFANLKYAQLQGAKFDIGSAITLQCADIRGVEIDETTAFPSSFDRATMRWVGAAGGGNSAASSSSHPDSR